ncbi:MAG TPA: magnesium transporter [Phycisphaerae bacterium]|nr:magnesium transporter [Phycisphaerae bacterium]
MQNGASQPDIYALIESRDFAALKNALKDMEVHDLADLLRDLQGENLGLCFRLLSQETAGEVLAELEPEQREHLITTLSSEKLAGILNDMAPDDRTELLEELPGELAQALLSQLRGEELQIARSLLAYPEDSIGRLMTPEYVAVRPEWTVQQVLDHIRKVGPDKETLNVLLAVGDGGRLVGQVWLEDLILAEPDRPVRELMEEHLDALRARDDREDAIEVFRKYDAVALPVLNRQDILVGIVTVDDVLDVAEEETTEDFQRIAGMEPLEYSYFGTGFLAMLRKRLPWLVMLLAAQTLTTIALLGFDKLPLFALLVLFMPLVNSPAGNTGTQMAGLMIRGLAVAEVGLKDWWRVLLRELTRGLALGLMLAVLGFTAALVFSYFAHLKVDEPWRVALSVSLAIAVAVTLANLLGSMLPFLFKRVGLDPAVTSGPFIASLMDVSGILIYFGIATTILAVTA